MPVYPLKFHIGPFEITGFGLMVMAGFLMAGWSMQRNLQERKLNEQYAWDIVFAAVVGGLIGAKLWYWALYPRWDALFSRSGMVWYGGLAGGSLAVLMNGWRLKIPTRLTADLVAPALAVGYAMGRIGCFLVQDDYGVPTTLPWGLKFPEGLPASTAANLGEWGIDIPPGTAPFEVLAVHPTQLYEVAAMLLVFWILWRLRANRHGMGWLFGIYLVTAGAERFLIEFIRAKDDRILGSLTVAQLASVAVIAIGVALMSRFWRQDDFTGERVKALKLTGRNRHKG